MSIQTGDTATIRRGKLAGTIGDVIAINDKEAVLKLGDGTFSTQALTNIKAPEVPTISADDLADIVSRNTGEDGQIFTQDLLSALDEVLPGFRKAYDNV